MVIANFPDISTAESDGLLAIGGDLEVASLLLAYSQGIFPWPFDESTLAWFAPPERAILEFANFHIPRSLAKEQRRHNFSFSVDKDFQAVIANCRAVVNRGEQRGTWITKQMESAYCDLHTAGHAHSFECYDNKQLVGGLYGVNINGIFSAESMFYRKPNASKLALWFAVDYLSFFKFTWLDVQVITPHLQRFNAVNVTRADFMLRLCESLRQPVKPFAAANITAATSELFARWQVS